MKKLKTTIENQRFITISKCVLLQEKRSRYFRRGLTEKGKRFRGKKNKK